jgi:CHAT domain-containing protein/Tfp pilus assembly protein PilF
MRRLRTRSLAASAIVVFIFLAISGCGSQKPAEPPQNPWAAETREEIRGLIRDASFDQAEAESRKLLAQAETEIGPDSVEAALALDLLVETLWRAQRASEPETLQLAERALQIKEQQLGPDAVQTCRSLLNLGVVLQFTGHTDQARQHYERAMQISEDTLGPSAPLVGDALVFLANMYLNISRYAEAEPLYERLIEIREATEGPDGTELAKAVNNLAVLTQATGDYARSRALYERALAIKEKAFGPDDLDVAWTVNGLASVQMATGDYTGARENFDRVLAIRETKLGSDHLHIAYSLNNVAYVLRLMGNYVGARREYDRSLAIMEEKLGPDHLHTAKVRNNIAELLFLTGDFREAKQIYEEVLKVRIKIFGPDDEAVGATLFAIATAQNEMKEYAEAEQSFARALQIYRDRLGEDHAEYAKVLSGQARLYLRTDRIADARALFQRALDIRKAALGSEHAMVAQSMDELAGVLVDEGALKVARPLAEKALRIRQKSFGSNHPLVGSAHTRLGSILAASGDLNSALDHALLAEEIGSNHLRLTIQFLPERRALQYAAVRSSGLDLALSLAAKGTGTASVWQAWNALCRSRALVLDEMARRHSAASDPDDAELAGLRESLSAANRRLANLTLSGPEEEHPERYLGLLRTAREEKEAAERALAKKSAGFRRALEGSRVGLEEVTEALPAKTALVAYAVYDDTEPAYLAFVRTARAADPVAVRLGKKAEIDELVSRWRREAAYGALVAERSPADAERAYRKAGETLRNRIWDPVKDQLGNAQRALVIPAGALHLINIAALPIGQSEYLIEHDPAIHLLTAERDVIAATVPATHGEGLLILGDPAYDDAMPEAPTVAQTFRSNPSDCADFRTTQFAALPGAEREARMIADLWAEAAGKSKIGEAQALIGAEAGEKAFKEQAPGKRVVHLSTHGFFLGDRCPSLLQGTRGIGALTTAEAPRPLPMIGENPLLLSGLAMAGANNRASAGPESEDGVLTAEEIASIDLQRVEWAVLSACDTGKGKVQVGEGVLGLRRSFQVAGAGTVIMSLWQVEDHSTREWMTELYRGRLFESMATDEAVRYAGLTILDRRREDRRSTHPFFWAAFVAAGDWR